MLARLAALLRSPLDDGQARRYAERRLAEGWSLTRVSLIVASIAAATLYLREVVFDSGTLAAARWIYFSAMAWPLAILALMIGRPSRPRLVVALVALVVGFSILAIQGNLMLRQGNFPSTTPTFMAILVGLVAVAPNFAIHALLAAIVMAISCIGLVVVGATPALAAFHVNYMLLTLVLTLTYTGFTERRRQRALGLGDELKTAEEALVAAEIDRARHERDFDGLTGLANRATFCRRLDRAIGAAPERSFAVLSFDIDGFNIINAAHGQEAGDAVLCALAARLAALDPPLDLAARIGGDQFALALPAAAAAGLEATLRQAGLLGFANGFDVRVSAGVARYPDDGDRAVTLLSRARAALVDGRERGDAGPAHYTAALDDALCSRRRLIEDLRAAVAADGLDVWFQPQLRLTDGVLIGAEALLRWQRHGVPVAPNEFIAVAEQEGLIGAVGAMALRRAVQAAASWQRAGFDLRVAVNISAAQMLAPDLVALIEATLDEFGLPARCLELEITESLYLDEGAALHATLKGLRRLGVALAIDDFGVGHSALARLTRLPVQSVKLDRSFVHGLPDDPATCQLVRGVIALARQLDLHVVAEGVETEAQAAWLRRRRCAVMQGFLIAPALSPDDFLAFARARGTVALPVG